MGIILLRPILGSPTLCSAPPPAATLCYATVRSAPLAAKFRSGTDCHVPLRSIPPRFATIRSGPLCISLLRSGTMRCGPFCAQLRFATLRYATLRYATLRSAHRQFRPELLTANSGRLRSARREFLSVLVRSLPPAVNSALSSLSRDVFRPISRYMLVSTKCLRAMALVVMQWLACECVVRTEKGTIFNFLVRGGIQK